MFASTVLVICFVTLVNSQYRECHDAFECYNETIYQETGIFSDGLFSAAQSWITLDDAELECYGEQSCYGAYISTIGAPDGDDPYGYSLKCYGEHSCSYSAYNLTDRGTMSFYASLALANSWINVTEASNNGWRFDFYGGFSGYGSTIMCDDDSPCEINCYGNGCNNLTLLCKVRDFDNNDNINDYEILDNCNFDIDCDDSEKNSYCPYGYDLGMYSDLIPNLYESDMYSLSNMTDMDDYLTRVSSISNSKMLCNDSNYSIMTDELICCGKENSCDEEHIYLGEFNDSSLDGIAIRCDGLKSCTGTIDGNKDDNGNNGTAYDIIAYNGGNIYITGEQAGWHRKISTDFDSDIICSAYKSCRESILSVAGNVYLTGHEAGYRSTVKDIENNVYVYGYNGIADGNISNINGNVYCIASSACEDAVFSNIVGNVIANGDLALELSEMTNIGGTVMGAGTRTLYRADITNVDSVKPLSIIYIHSVMKIETS